MLGWLKNYTLIGLLAALTVTVGLLGVQTLRLAHTQTSFANHKAEVAELQAQRERTYSDDLKASRDGTDALQQTVDTNQRSHDAKIALIHTRHADTVASLRQRPESRATRVSAATHHPAAAEGATGLQLSGPDGRFLAGEAARADTLRAALQTCYSNYDAARDGLKSYTEAISK